MYKIRKSNRLKDYDYSQTGCYFITICTKNFEYWFGEVVDEVMLLNNIGKIVIQRVTWLESNFNYIKIDSSVVMPNHVHLIINNVGTGLDLSLPVRLPLANIVGALKTTSSKLIHQAGFARFAWQRSYYDHIIRNEKSLNKIREYIINNPAKWYLDKYQKNH